MKAMNHKNPFNKEWEKLLNVVNELLKKYSNIILSRTKINPNYIIPKFDDYAAKYLFARRQFRFNHSDCILIANHRNMPYDVELYKPNTTVSIKNYGSNENININIDSKTNKISFSIPEASYIWLKGKDTEWEMILFIIKIIQIMKMMIKK